MSIPPDILAVIMAGGQGARMRASGATLPKPLVTTLGVPLLLRAIHQLIRFGVRRAVVATPALCPQLGQWVREVGAPSAAAGGLELLLFEETTPLGTLGAVAEVAGEAPNTLVINADNLAALDLDTFINHHQSLSAFMTVATHTHRWRMPYAELASDGPWVRSYVEKPTFTAQVSSGAYILDRRAVSLMGRGPLDAPTLVNRLLEAGHGVATYAHSAPWMDINDTRALPAADDLIRRHRERFEALTLNPDVQVVGALIRGPKGILLERRSAHAGAHPNLWDTPGGKIETGENPEEALRREMLEELGVALSVAEPIATFDDICPASRRIIRHHTFRCAPTGEPTAAEGQELRWHPEARLPSLGAVSPVVWRTLAWEGHS